MRVSYIDGLLLPYTTTGLPDLKTTVKICSEILQADTLGKGY
jgi:tryptophan synthase alpha subunit